MVSQEEGFGGTLITFECPCGWRASVERHAFHRETSGHSPQGLCGDILAGMHRNWINHGPLDPGTHDLPARPAIAIEQRPRPVQEATPEITARALSEANATAYDHAVLTQEEDLRRLARNVDDALRWFSNALTNMPERSDRDRQRLQSLIQNTPSFAQATVEYLSGDRKGPLPREITSRHARGDVVGD
jgi:hypothetical protein